MTGWDEILSSLPLHFIIILTIICLLDAKVTTKAVHLRFPPLDACGSTGVWPPNYHSSRINFLVIMEWVADKFLMCAVVNKH